MTMKIPDASHPITIEKAGTQVKVTWQGKVIADTDNALALAESTYPIVHYIPRTDVSPEVLERSDHTTYCPYKGTANYFSLVSESGRGDNAVWTYEDPYEAVVQIKDYVAFYPNVVDAIEVG